MGYKILKKEILAPGIKSFEISAPLVSNKFKPGQFLVLRLHEKAERIPLTIVDAEPSSGSVKIVFQEIGKSTIEIAKLNENDEIMDVLGPLGKESEIELYGEVLGIAGGVGAAPVYPILKSLKKIGNRITTILGAKSRELLIMEEELSGISDKLLITTDDGSKGEKGFVTTPLKLMFEQGFCPQIVWAIGPLIMMKNVCAVTKSFGIKTIVSLNPIMLDGTGMCGCCRVSIGNKTKFTCVDGPEFDGHLVDFNELILRNNRFIEEEKISLERYNNE
ncbi:ferredoxin-NADP reductase [Candidatus Desantisbacteria bacterium CG1_02_38_46]|uniref:Ferredoxin-NADP reductase n=3 Tax=unclassified Candidatus Desantisiibacteriota TaxID=3106372 RepID=A0A2H9PC29_9BACT|nr:MAG: ferredoxin-NADP reductase [Candidatus Desantisbacteria bacterium CG1_02_38_46]PIU50979.1 MAG: ferredoxin-NADP reductase [Candidatus Desantisbacteria bacterium CG07_land_8_20_14_0_80_39_15]PIZ16581.1 MAG: ferredoxin-NADP reductase [Candidatus Desantisbacteria bacterium CG_4_10_14_0_8_um_filter_39_17]